jgi:hypothetical protein
MAHAARYQPDRLRCARRRLGDGDRHIVGAASADRQAGGGAPHDTPARSEFINAEVEPFKSDHRDTVE